MTIGFGGSAFAGEVTGAGGTSGPNGDGTTGMRGHAASECGFSGLEDHPEEPTSPPPNTPDGAIGHRRITQTPHLVWFDIPENPADHFWLKPDPGSPGFACSPGRPLGD